MTIMLKDLNESQKLDENAMSALLGGHGFHLKRVHLHSPVKIHRHKWGIPHPHFSNPIHLHTIHIGLRSPIVFRR